MKIILQECEKLLAETKVHKIRGNTKIASNLLKMQLSATHTSIQPASSDSTSRFEFH